MSWRCLAPSEHGIARPRTWHALGGFRQCGTESQQNDALVRSASAIHSTADQGSVVTLVSLCEGFRTTARCDSAGRHRGRRPKASREGTRGELRCGMCHALWRFERPTKASPFWTILFVIRPEPLGRGFGSGNASIEPTTSSRSAPRDRPLSFASRHLGRAFHGTISRLPLSRAGANELSRRILGVADPALRC